MYESLRVISIRGDPARRYVKMVQEVDGKTFEFSDGVTSAQGNKNFYRRTDRLRAGTRVLQDRPLHGHVDECSDRNPV